MIDGRIMQTLTLHPIALPIVDGNLRQLRKLLANGCDPEIKLNDTWKPTPLIYACFCDSDNWDYAKANKFVKLLLRHKASIETKDGYGCSPLISAIAGDNMTFIEVLLENGASATSQALFETILRTKDDASVASLLLEAGAEFDVETLDAIDGSFNFEDNCVIACLKNRKFRASLS